MSEVDPVHPRACGERPNRQRHGTPSPRVRTVPFISSSGSSPRVRGTVLRLGPLYFHPRGGDRAVPGRFIPARAGNGQLVDEHAAATVHPRACGERPGGVRLGSSPRVQPRWTVHPRACGERLHRERRGVVLGHGAVHPRACGERSGIRLLPRGSLPGSSPRVRGTGGLVDCRTFGRPARFIPARAGNGDRLRRSRYHSVHPRACGAHTATRHNGIRFIPARAGNGSSGSTIHRPCAARFIPARAGNGLDVMLFIICDLHAG